MHLPHVNSMTRRRSVAWWRFSAMVFVCLLCLLGLTTPVRADHAPLEKVSLQLRWFHQFQFAGYYAAKANGYYAEVGLDVEIIERDLKVNPVDAVLWGKADYGVTNSEVLLHRLKGKPVIALASIFQHSPLVLLTTKVGEISTVHDLLGKRVLMSTKTTDVELLGMLQKENVGLEELEIVDRFSRKEDYFDKSLDAIAAYITNQPYYLDSNDILYHVLYPSTYGIDFYGDGLFTSEEQIRSHPQRTAAFLEASLRGWEYAMAHQEEIIDLILAEYPTKKTRAHLEYEAAAMEKLILPELVQIGHMNPGRWEHIAEVFRNVGLVDSIQGMDGFLYEPSNYSGVESLEFFLYGLILVIVALGMIGLFLGYFNRRLQTQVDARTEALSVKALELEEANSRLKELDRVKSALLSSVSHELRTPLTAVLGFVKLVEKEFDRTFAPLVGDDEHLEQRRIRISKNLKVISVEGERLTRLISDVLDLTRIESGKAIWRDQAIDPTELARNAVAVVQEQFAQNPATQLKMDVQDDLPLLHADPDRIVQVLINLLSNAAKFTPKGEVRLTVVRNDDGNIRMEVKDSGVGVPKSELEHVFNLFHQVRRGDTLKLNAQGAGLGLAICKEIVEHYNGSITLESEEGKGSVFTVLLPVTQDA